MNQTETDAELIRKYQNAYARAYWYSGNNPGRQRALDNACHRLADDLWARGLRAAEYEAEAINTAVTAAPREDSGQ